MGNVQTIVLVVMIGLGLLALAGAVWYERKRRQAIIRFAEQLGLAYHPSLLPDDERVFQRFSLSSRGRGRRATDAIVADSGQLRVVIFDYRYTTGGGKNSTTYRQTVALVHAPGLDLPAFSLEPESFLHRVGNLLGFDDIDFEDDREFSKKILLRGADEDAVREFMTPQRRRALLEFADMCIEADGDDFLFYRRGRRSKPDRFKQMMEQALAIFKTLSGPPAS